MNVNYVNTKKQHQVNPTNVVRFNVGGNSFTSIRETLSGSKYICNLIKSNDKKLKEQRELFINRDGDLFRQVLLYLRTGLILPKDEEGIKKLLSEAKFYQCQEMVNALEAQLEKFKLSQQAPTKMGLEFIDLKKMFDDDNCSYTLLEKTGDKVEAFSVVDYINVFSRNEFKDKKCQHRRDDCGCYYYPKLVLVPHQKH